MFKLPYFYYYLAAWLLLICLQRVVGSDRADVGTIMKGTFTQTVFVLCTISLIVFLILGFWYMPEWWYPLAFFGMSLVVAVVPLPDKIGAILALVGAPVLCVLAYLSLFGVL